MLLSGDPWTHLGLWLGNKWYFCRVWWGNSSPGFSCWILEPLLLPWAEAWYSPASSMWALPYPGRWGHEVLFPEAVSPLPCLVPTHSVVVGFLMSPKKFHPKNQSWFFLEEKAVLITMLCRVFVSFCDLWRCSSSHWGVMLGWPQLCNAVTWNTVGFGIFYCIWP